MNYSHGMTGTSTYYCWQHLKRAPGGVCLSWRKFSMFLADTGSRPSSNYWLFRTRPYQRSRPGNVEWRPYKRSFKSIWRYLTVSEILACMEHIEVMCLRAGYDLDFALNELFLQDLARAKDPVVRIHSWIKRYLPRILSVLKKRRSEVCYNDEVRYVSKI